MSLISSEDVLADISEVVVLEAVTLDGGEYMFEVLDTLWGCRFFGFLFIGRSDHSLSVSKVSSHDIGVFNQSFFGSGQGGLELLQQSSFYEFLDLRKDNSCEVVM